MAKVGKVVSVDLREVWQHEATDFSKWLAENLDTLGDALDMSLEVIETEKKIDDSRYSIDILAEDENEESVIIENQLEKTDHSHLGQIVTYVSNMDATTAIWITKNPRQEHINAINWLNEIGNKRFFLVTVETFKIDDSNPAPFFSVICRPSTESKKLGQSKKAIEEIRKVRRVRREVSDTVIVPGRKDGFDKVFLGEHCWYAIRLRKDRIPQIRYIAGYQVAPVSAITHIAKVKDIVPYADSGKYKVIFEEPARKIKPVPIGNTSKIQGPAYCEYSKLGVANTIDDLFQPIESSSEDDVA
ncbi:MAG: DUF4268 domain-containing protein [Oligoflexales bacterium]